MRMSKFVALALVTVALVPGQASASVSKAYVAGSLGDVEVICENDTPAGLNVGGACFTSGFASLNRLTVTDATDMPVGVWATWYNGTTCADVDPDTGLCNLHFIGCGGGNVGATLGNRLLVALDGPVFGPLDCGLETGYPGAATNGTIKLG